MAADDLALTLAAIVAVGAAAVGIGLGAWLSPLLEIETIHMPVWVHLWPQMMTRPWKVMVQLILVKVTVHLALHMVTTERRE